MIDQLTHETFAVHQGETFPIVLAEGGAVDLELVEVKPWGAPHRAGARQPFTLLFRHTQRDTFLPQSTYHLEHPAFDMLELFLVPLGPDAQGMRYEAVFT